MRDALARAHLSARLAHQLSFCIEIDRVKQVIRHNPVIDGSRRENDAEHMWHLAVMALILSEYSPQPLDVSRVIGMVLVHDLVEIDAGDAFVYDEAARAAAPAKEKAAAERIFGILPADQREWLRGLWDEFEEKQSAEARFAGAIDRLQPMLMNATADGGGWARHGITADRVMDKNSVIDAGAPELWTVARQVIEHAVEDGVLAPAPTDEK